ncbi:hypothetical protein LAZ67_3005463, partial [Cordylochernes scorpioides]
MNHERFLFLLRFLGSDDLPTREIRKRLTKLAPIRAIFEEFVTNCKTMYHPGEYLTVDENIIPFKFFLFPLLLLTCKYGESCMGRNALNKGFCCCCIIPFKGRCSFKQYLPNKLAKYDIKTYVLCCSRKSYVVNLNPEIITFYKITKGVDLLDQKTSLYSVGRRTKIWPLCIFFELLNISGVNYELLFEGNQPQNIYKRRKDFLKALSLELVTEYQYIRSTTKSFSKPLRSIVRKHAGQSPETK